jgi:hypothetical protein
MMEFSGDFEEMRTLGWKVKGKFVFRRGFKTVVPDSESSS